VTEAYATDVVCGHYRAGIIQDHYDAAGNRQVPWNRDVEIAM